MSEPIISTVDIVLLIIQEDRLCVTLSKRDKEPYENQDALPGGYIHAEDDRDCLDAAVRILQQKTGLLPPYLEQLKTFAGAARDPRGWSISVVYFALVDADLILSATNPGLTICPVDALRRLPFDHNEIIAAAVDRIRNKSQYSSLPCYLAGETFSLPRLQKIYEACLGETLNKVSFRRKMDELGVLETVAGQTESAGAHRPAQLYRLKSEFKNQLKLLVRGL
ncbi:NUDIX domain-containing protein [Methylomonas sp. MO1]|uniref:NUDIX hydrolase n=1 Tax=Methylomonas sp. MO1 TaxID=3073619 RepID=UPI0028A3C6CA|nr:NUDIX domain-containing protein [Methylomonas sp. MO1]MDT4289375.1 NUDIX domain-containing protein [Methylomonas sp. MO1]